MTLQNDRKYTNSHEWLLDLGNGSYRIGLSDFAQNSLGDIVFIDPPFGAGTAGRCLGLLAASSLLAPGARVYVECGAGEAAPELPAGWLLHREKFAGQVAYRLYLAPG